MLTYARTDGRTDDGRKVITIAHPEQSSGELKCKAVARMPYNVRAFIVRKRPVSKTFENRAKSYVNPAFVLRLSYSSRTASPKIVEIICVLKI